tara:strand:+ start:189 stop:959 length:771 start_codon:yes stop_codon:yes gene_type:complete
MENKKQILIDNNKLLKIIEKSIDEGLPLSVVRKGDGENVLIGFNKIKGISINKYLKKLKHFNIRKLDFKFQNFFKKKLIESFMNADYLGIAKDYSYSSIRKFDNEITKYYKLDVKNLIDSHFHLEFVKNPNNNQLINPYAQNIISNKKIGIISHLNVSKFLAIHNTVVNAQFSIPKRNAGFFKKMSLKKFDYIIDSISNVKKEVDVWFVAAGPYAKVFCNHIKSINGIGIDVGSAMDTWVGEYHSRKYLRELNENV